jgi:hypothetical protein
MRIGPKNSEGSSSDQNVSATTASEQEGVINTLGQDAIAQTSADKEAVELSDESGIAMLGLMMRALEGDPQALMLLKLIGMVFETADEEEAVPVNTGDTVDSVAQAALAQQAEDADQVATGPLTQAVTDGSSDDDKMVELLNALFLASLMQALEEAESETSSKISGREKLEEALCREEPNDQEIAKELRALAEANQVSFLGVRREVRTEIAPGLVGSSSCAYEYRDGKVYKDDELIEEGEAAA